MSHSAAYERFQSSKIIDRDKWHDGEGYDLDAFAAMSPAERDAEADAMIADANPDWRDLVILGAHGGAKSIERLRDLLLHPSINTRAHALGVLISHDHVPGAAADVQLAHVIDALDDEDDEGLTHALLLAQSHAGPMSKLALLRGVRYKPALALHFASALLDLAELSDDMAAFDPKFRPLLLRLLPDNAPPDRAEALQELCRLLRVEPEVIAGGAGRPHPIP